MKSMMGKCEFCGNEIGVMAESEAEANKLAAEQCACAGVRLQEKKESLCSKLEELAGSLCDEQGFTPVDPEVLEIIRKTGCTAIDGKIQAAAFKVDGTTISIKAGDKTKVTRKYIFERAAEIK